MKLFFLIGLIIINLLPTSAKVVKKPDVDVELISEYSIIRAGEEFWLGLRLKMKNNCHIYWSNPGDVGIPTRIALNIPDGFSDAKVYFPVPKLFIETGIASLIYENEIIIPIKIYVPEDFRAKNFSVSADVNWLACKDICTADSAKPSLIIKIGSNNKLNHKWAEKIRKAVKALPIKADLLNVKAIRYDNSINLMFNIENISNNTSIKNAIFLPYEQGIYELAEEQIFKITSNRVTLVIPLSDLKVKEPENLAGILKLIKNEPKDYTIYEINVPIINNYMELK